MKFLKIALCLGLTVGAMSCGQTGQQDNATHNKDTMVIKQDKTDSATKTITTDTTKR